MTDNVTQPNSTPNPTPSIVDELVGPGKKFKTTEDAIKGKLEADAFVVTLTKEAKELRAALQAQLEENERLKSRASIIDRLNQPNEETVTNPSPNAAAVTPQVQPGLSAEDVVSLIRKTDQQKVAEANLNLIDSTLVKTFGADAVAVVRQRAAELGMDTAELMQVGAKSPQAFFNMVGVQPKSSPGNPIYSGAPIAGQPGVEVKNKRYFDKIRQEMGNTKFIMDRNLQLEMHKQAQILGDDYYK